MGAGLLIYVMPAPNPWRSAEKAVSSDRLDRMEGIATMPAAFAPSLPGELRAKLDMYGIPYKHVSDLAVFCGVKSKYSVTLSLCIELEHRGLSTAETRHSPYTPLAREMSILGCTEFRTNMYNYNHHSLKCERFNVETADVCRQFQTTADNCIETLTFWCLWGRDDNCSLYS